MHERADSFKGYVAGEGGDGSYSNLSRKQRCELDGLIIQSVLLYPTEAERRDAVQEATGVSSLAFSGGLFNLINSGVLERNTLEFETTADINSES